MRAITTSRVACEFDRFLYSSLGEDANGMPLTVLSALARMDLDPWEEAAKLVQLPKEVAVKQLGSVIGCLPNASNANIDPAYIAVPLIALLPRSVHRPHPLWRAFAHATPLKSPALVSTVLSVLTYVILMLFSNWWTQDLQSPRQRHLQSSATSAPTIEVPSTASGVETNQTIEGPP